MLNQNTLYSKKAFYLLISCLSQSIIVILYLTLALNYYSQAFSFFFGWGGGIARERITDYE